MNPRNFFAELKRRNVYKVAIAYAVVAWLLIQMASILFPAFEAPGWLIKVFVAVVAAGFPIALLLAWAFELTPEGVKRTDEGEVALSPSAPKPPERSIAVLPFENLSADPENAFFADGVQDEILTNLANIAALKVISRSSVMQYRAPTRHLRQIGSALGVAHILEGSVQRAGNRVRVSAQLIDLATEAHLWAQNYHRPLDDVFAIQSEIARAVADQLQAKLSPAEEAAIEQPPTVSLVAYDRYLRGKKAAALISFDNRSIEHLRQAVRFFDQALTHDPAFLLAYCELARAHGQLHFFGIDHTPARLALANKTLEMALKLAPDRGEPHLTAAWIQYQCYRDYDRALAELGIAQSLMPNNTSVFELISYISRRQGDWERCTANFERAAELDPHNLFLLQQSAQTYQWLRRFSKATATLDRALAIALGDPPTRLARAMIDLEWHADTQPAYAAVQDILAKDPGAIDAIAEEWFYLALCQHDPTEIARAVAAISPDGIQPINVRLSRSFCEGLAARAQGREAAAESAFLAAHAETRNVLHEQPDYAEALCVLAMADAALGRKEDAIAEGRRAVELFPASKDAVTGAELARNLAIIYAWTGENELAFVELEKLSVAGPVSSGQLRLHAWWDPLRADQRFEQIIDLFAPKDVPT